MNIKKESRIIIASPEKMSLTLLLLIFSFFLIPLIPITHAAGPSEEERVNINDDKFSLVNCDGPTIPKDWKQEWKDAITGKNPNYKPCDFGGLMRQVQRLINVAMIVGVLAAILGFVYAGYLYISVSFTGKTDNRGKANQIFQNVFWGFIIMLSAWFIVYQILSWLQCKNSDPNCKPPGGALLRS